MKSQLIITSALFFLCACKFEVKGPDDKSADDASAVPAVAKNSEGTKIRNGIELQTNGIQVEQAFLTYDDGKLVPQNNTTEVDKPIKLKLIINKGWQEANGLVSLGASERIETAEGQVILNEEDLFKDYATINANDAKYISLTASIARLDKLHDYFLVNFRVWDKNGTGEVKGSYKFYIQ